MNDARKDKGAVLLTTLLIMSLMSALAVAMMSDLRTAILRSGNVQAHAQADWLVKAAEDFAGQYIEENFLSLEPAEQNFALQQDLVSSLPVEGGVMNLRILDGTQCLPLSSLAMIEREGNNQEQAEDFSDVFQRLLILAGMNDLEAQSLTAAVIDWQDADQRQTPGGAEDFTYLALVPAYRTPNVPVLSVSELRAIRGMNEDVLELIAPYLCAGDETRAQGRVNINTLGPEHLPLLSAMIGPNSETLADQILKARPQAGFENLETELVEAGIDIVKVNPARFTTRPDYIWVEVDIELGLARRTGIRKKNERASNHMAARKSG